MNTRLAHLVEQLASEQWSTRYAAYVSLQKMGSKIVDALIEGLRHENRNVRKACAALMDHFADERCAEPLAQALEDPIADVRRHALHSIVCDRCKTVPLNVDAVGLVVKHALEDSSIRIRRKATTTLGLLPTVDRHLQDALETLRHDDDAEVRRRANWSFRRISERTQMV